MAESEAESWLVRGYAIILFDGKCRFCNFWVRFVVRRDRRGRFRFAALETDTARRLISRYGPAAANSDSVVLIMRGNCYIESTAALRICGELDGGWRWLRVLLLIPKPLRDAVYRWVARRRHRFWPPSTDCPLPGKDVRERFLDREEG